MDCIFCRIINGEIPCYKVYEDDYVMAFLDISQVTKGHTLLVPKTHVRNIYELDASTAQTLFQALPKVAYAIKQAFHPIGLTTIINTDKPHQSVFHLHIHLIPRYENDGFEINFDHSRTPVSPEEFKIRQNALSQQLQ
jgi:histidine triad (HIT) family protein